ncbi:YtxH domain-containing protein [Agilicoccus flavus]|uniref:YtxH domain-containing protein n=1 Tax=Agilicoccus flavus TaxID=2775968 RepID=UPI001CF68B9C|nr:YtxH domain-containing protein [Agilicoccus flavus]
MQRRILFLAGAAVGYVLGARDGRGRYEQIKSQADSLWNDPRVQEKVNQAGQTVKDRAPEVQAKVADAASHASDAAKAKVAGATSQATGAAKAKLSRDKSDDNLIGQEPGSNYTPAETKFNSAG